MGKNLSTEQIVDIITLSKAGHPDLYIAKQTGLAKRSIQRWTKKFKDLAPGSNFELQKKPPGPGKPRKTSARTLNVLRLLVEAEPTITARQLIERNPELLGGHSISTIRRCLCVDLWFRRVLVSTDDDESDYETDTQVQILTKKRRKNVHEPTTYGRKR